MNQVRVNFMWSSFEYVWVWVRSKWIWVCFSYEFGSIM